MDVIAHLRNDFPTKFSLPRQSLLCGSLTSRVVFTPSYRNKEALRGLEGFSHIWLVWEFSGFASLHWTPTVRPPRLGGNKRMGVFATRSPHRPNHLGLSCVRLAGIDFDCPDGPCLIVEGADMMDGTPIYDIKPYIREADCHPEATDGFLESNPRKRLTVEFESGERERLSELLSPNQMETLVEVLSEDPRPSYQDDPERIYGFSYAGLEIHFTVDSSVLIVKYDGSAA